MSRKYVAIILLIAVAGVGWLIYFPRQSVGVTVRFLDVGQGDAALISRGRTQLLIDGGPSDVLLDRLDHALPIGDRVIEHALITHPHADHYRGLCLLGSAFRIQHLYVGVTKTSNHEYTSCIERLSRQAQVHIVDGPRIIGESPLSLDVIYPTRPLSGADYRNPNNASLVTLFRFGQTRILFPGDAETEEEHILSDLPVRAEIMKVPHHGSATSSTPEFLQAVRPRFCVISLGARNRYNHPSGKTLQTLNEHSCHVRRTDHHGTITLRLTQERYSVETERR